MTSNTENTVRAKYHKTIGIVNNYPLGGGFAHAVVISIKDQEMYVLN